MATQLYYNAFVPAFSNIGVALGNSQLFFYYTNTTTKAPIFADAAASIPLANPVQANLAGKYPNIYLQDGTIYRVQQTDQYGASIGDAVDPYLPGRAVAGPMGPAGSISISGINYTTPQQFGAVADNTTDSLPAFKAALAYLLTKGVKAPGSGYIGAPKLFVPCGVYFLNGTLDVGGATIIIEGEGTGQAGGNATVLRFPASTAGIRIQAFNTTGEGVISGPTASGADGTIIRNLELLGGGGSPSILKSGIWCRSRSVISGVVANGFAGAGILVRANYTSSDPTFVGNANCWKVDQARLINNGSGGLVVQGPDANAGVAVSVDASNNTGYGIDDGSFLGNTYVGCHMEANSVGPWIVRDSNAMVNMDAYTEPGQGNSVSSPGTIATGRQFVPVTDNGGTTLRAAGLAGGGLQSSTGFTAVPAQANTCRVGFGRGASMIDLTPSGADTYRFVDGGNGAIAVTYANLGNLAPLWMYPDGSSWINKLRLTTSAGATLGTVVKKVQVFNQDGSSAGYVPVYDQIN